MPHEQQQLAAVEVSGVRRKVNVDLLLDDGLRKDDWVLIHVGFAMSKLSAEQAEEQLRLLETLGEATAALEEVQGYDFDDGTSSGSSDGSSEQESFEEKFLEDP